MPVGTQGAVKALTAEQLAGLGAEIILGNTYHLYLRPGDELIAQVRRPAPLHRLGPADPDRQRRLPGLQSRRTGARSTRKARNFRSHLDGSPHLLTPETAADIQAQLGSDIAMVLDECLGQPATRDQARASMER